MKLVQQAKAALPDFARELCGVAGTALITYGAWRIYAPAGYIVLGLILFAFAAMLSGRISG